MVNCTSWDIRRADDAVWNSPEPVENRIEALYQSLGMYDNIRKNDDILEVYLDGKWVDIDSVL